MVATEAAAAEAGTAVVVVGLTAADETEAIDRSTLTLPGRQDGLVRRVAAAATRTVVVVNAATPVLMPWLADVDAVLIAGLPGQEAGDAILDVLVGERRPTGRLVTSYPTGTEPRRPGTSPRRPRAQLRRGGLRRLSRVRRRTRAGARFWFGHGLGDGTWRYDGVDLLDAGAVQVPLSNVGERTSRETVQVYFRPDDTAQPVRLGGYAGIELAAGAAGVVDVATDPRLGQRWSPDEQAWVPVGPGEPMIARGLGDVRLRVRSD